MSLEISEYALTKLIRLATTREYSQSIQKLLIKFLHMESMNCVKSLIGLLSPTHDTSSFEQSLEIEPVF